MQPPEMFCKKSVLGNFAKFTGTHLCQSLFFNKVAALKPATLLKKRLWHRCFPVNFAKFLRIPFLKNTSGRLLLLLFSFDMNSCHNSFLRQEYVLMSSGVCIFRIRAQLLCSWYIFFNKIGVNSLILLQEN